MPNIMLLILVSNVVDNICRDIKEDFLIDRIYLREIISDEEFKLNNKQVFSGKCYNYACRRIL